ncbi:uncharacterized protein L203_104861 [Cryptococcus depauperatus CBS 7841]|uniref:Uncharacterized protein n=1 Tax=Cryptococcus depauperatus CBS 7841 TaxID=1295531 RepID=A0A1E3IN35_9TREE|nr:pathway-specific nitrogen regulator [Cryptococcus depauperatus CBS 7841]
MEGQEPASLSPAEPKSEGPGESTIDPSIINDSNDLPEGKRRRGSFDTSKNENSRVLLACFYCRGKRVRCSGTKPRCEVCMKANVECEWPAARAKKRTKKEMEEARRAERMAPGPSQQVRTKMPVKNFYVDSNDQDLSNFGIQGHPAYPLTHPASSSHYMWPPDLATFPLDTVPNSASTSTDTAPVNVSQFPQMTRHPGATLTMGNATPGIQHQQPVTMSNRREMLPPSMHMVPSTSNGGKVPLGNGTISGGMGFLGEWSPNNNLRLASALESQSAFITGNPEEDGDLELFYYRFVGSTAIRPGINRISLKLQRRDQTASSPHHSAIQLGHDSPLVDSPLISQDLFDSTGMPHEHVWRPLFALFFKHQSQHFPNSSYNRMMERFETGTMSQFLACCMCSLGARFSPDARDPAQASAPFIAKAQELVAPLLHLPTHDALTGLLYLSWANYGLNSESGLWQFTGIANRMAIDLGVHEISEIYESPSHLARIRLLFWALFVTDRVITFGMGRPPGIPEDIIEIPLPTDVDFFPDSARDFPSSPHESVEPVPFAHLVKLMVIVGRISNVLNGRRGRALTLVQTPEPLPELLEELQLRLVTFYSNLPPSLKWSADNFKHQHVRGHSGTYLALHLWVNAVLVLIYHPELLKSPSGMETPLNKSMQRNVQLSLASSRQIVECMVFADLVDSSSYTNSGGFLSQPVFVAAMAFIHEMRSLQSTMDPTMSTPLFPSDDDTRLYPNNPHSNHTNLQDILMLSIAKQNFTTLLNAIYKMEEYWAGVSHVSALLEKRSGFQRPSEKARKKTFISLPDKGLLKRFTTDPHHPQSVGPPTDTSLRDAIARSERASSANTLTPLWLSDLMPGYTVENMSFAPADSFDLERLLATNRNDQ